MIADLRLVVAPWPRARRRSISARVRPAPKAPILRKSRRVWPSQKRRRWPHKVNMLIPPLEGNGSRRAGGSSASERNRWTDGNRGRSEEQPHFGRKCGHRGLSVDPGSMGWIRRKCTRRFAARPESSDKIGGEAEKTADG